MRTDNGLPTMVRNKETRLLYRVFDCVGTMLLLEPVVWGRRLTISLRHLKEQFDSAD
jgi:hypothetical protein